jgi:NO-binding membrane sensor protein with MHYT domain
MIHIDNFTYGALNPVLAYLASCVGCFAGLRCTTRARALTGAARARWLTAAALAIGTTGIWVMHFIAMLGFTIPGQQIRYNVPITILSMLIAVIVVGIGIFIVGFSRPGAWPPLLLGGAIIGIGVACMHYIGMAAIRVPDSLNYNPVVVAASVVIAVIAGTAALWAALRLDSLWSAIIASMIMGVAVSSMHYTGMAALSAHAAAPGLTVSYAWAASAEALLLPLILGLSSVGLIFSTVLSLSPTAAEMVEEAELMARIGRAPQHEPYRQAVRQPWPGDAGQNGQRNGQAEGQQNGQVQPGSLFRPSGPGRRPDAGLGHEVSMPAARRRPAFC